MGLGCVSTFENVNFGGYWPWASESLINGMFDLWLMVGTKVGRMIRGFLR